MPNDPSDERTAAAAPVARLWTSDEADRRLPTLTELLTQLTAWAERLGQVHAELTRLAGFWGEELGSSDQPDHEIRARLDREAKNLTTRLHEALHALRSEGIEVKDLATGLVDFYALHDGELVFLCWKLGEPEVAFYHTLEGGFAGRRPLGSRSMTADPSSR